MLRFVLGLGLLLLASAIPHQAEAQQSVGPIFLGNRSCALDISQGATWAHYTSADLKDQTSTANTAAACPASQRFSSCTVLNTHATLKLWVVPASLTGAAPATTNRLVLLPGQSVTYPVYGLYPLDVSVRGEAGPSTGQIACFAVPQ